MKAGKKGRNILFNDMLNTFYIWLHGVRHVVKVHSDREKEGTWAMFSMGYVFQLAARDLFMCTIPKTG